MLCRFCLFELGTAFDLNDDHIKLTKLVSEVMVLENDRNSDIVSPKICQECFIHLDGFSKFCEKIADRQREFYSHLQNGCLEVKIEDGSVDGFPSDDVQQPNVISAEHQLLHGNNIEMLLDIRDAELLVNAKDFLMGEPEYTRDNCAEDNASNDSFDGDDNIPLLNFISEKNLSNLEANNEGKEVKRCAKKKQGKKSSRLKSKCSKGNSDSIEQTKQIEPKDARDDGDSNEHIESFIAQHLRLKCEMCETPMESFVKLKKHFSAVHHTKGFVVCCGRQFYRRFILTEHIQLHLNPHAFKCDECGKILTSKSCLEIHKKNRHVNKAQLRFSCEVCNRRFAGSNNLRAHSLTHASKKEFSCGTCQKAFKTNYSLQVHIKAIHDDVKAFICDMCGKNFKFKPSFQRHIAEHLGDYKAEPTEQCLICGKWLMKNGLKKHMDTHNKTEVECPKCGKRLCSKSALNSHIKYIHVDKPLLKCSYCEKLFKQKNNLKEHMAIHTGTKDYSCPHCSREFRSKANMYVHVKRNHVNEWMQAQVQRTKIPLDSSQKHDAAV